ncbi:CocE/NonD family hydrolase [Nocardioides sp. R-C-SC26]|uniref:CocE/NonD family hydrolase n=1 Tax=Nocardioides sp. R-C-SC26 TaxID=2870414 RepID=UPI001E438956|nr:CocE/NonD family hydrolase [Nocardioides sp. R-C-SC26]
MLPRLRATFVVILTTLLTVITLGPGAMPAHAAASPTEVRRTTGYLTVSDGTRLKWTLLSPGPGRYPVLMQYEGYNAGSNPGRVNEEFVAEMLADGYAVLGVSIRGTACSGGEFELFDPRWGSDGAEAVTWASRQPWSTGKVGMFSFSYAGIAQLLTAARRPAGLAAIAPGMVVSDMYRDVGYPGGIANSGFPVAWEAALHVSWAQALTQARADGDVECVVNVLRHQALGLPRGVVLSGLAHPYRDAFFTSRSPERGLGRIQVPVLGEMAWQDEQTGPRGGLAFEKTNPETTWTVGTNGIHGMYAASPSSRRLLHRYFDHFLKGEQNGWQRTPHHQLWFESSLPDYEPRFVVSTRRHRMPTTTRRLYLGAGGRLDTARPRTASPATGYLTPGISPSLVSEALVVDPATFAGGLTWQLSPVLPGTSAAFTTPPLKRDLLLAGSASLDLWVRAQTRDADVQVTVTEVRPDGQEVYVQRGWLRLSHRALVRSESTSRRPVHPFTRGAQRNLPIGRAVLARVEILPFAQAFRAGSRLRIYVDSPSATGLWAFLPNSLPTGLTPPSRLEVLHDAEHPSALVVGRVGDDAPGNAPACGTLVSQPCRPDPLR